MNRKNFVKQIKSFIGHDDLGLLCDEVKVGSKTVHRAFCETRTGDNILCGSGADLDSEVAIDKALSELVERIAFRRFKDKFPDRPEATVKFFPFFAMPQSRFSNSYGRQELTTVGCSVSFGRSLGLARAKQELLEKHTLLLAQIAGTHGKADLPYVLKTSTTSFLVRPFLWTGPLDTFACLSEVTNEQGATTFACGSGDSEHQALHKALLEATLMVSNLTEPKSTPANDRAIRRLINRFREHPPSVKFYASKTPISSTPTCSPADVAFPKFYYFQKRLFDRVYFTRAWSPDLQVLHAEGWNEQAIHPRWRRLYTPPSDPPYAL